LGLRPGNASLLLSHRLGGNEWQLVQRSGPLIALNLEGGLPAAADHILPLAVHYGSLLRRLSFVFCSLMAPFLAREKPMPLSKELVLIPWLLNEMSNVSLILDP